MIKRIAVLFCLFLCIPFLSGQTICDDDYEYSGDPGDIIEDSTGVIPGSLVQIDFCTYNVPDRLTIYFCNDTLTYYIGTTNIPFESDYIQGYAQITYENSKETISYPSSIPYGEGLCIFYRGRLRLFLHIPTDCCLIKWKISGNTFQQTDYSFCLDVLDSEIDSTMIVDSISIIHCQPEYYRYLPVDSCKFIQVHYIDGRNEIEPIITNPTCSYESDGSIEFSGIFSQYNLYDLDTGFYEINIDLTSCIKTITVQLTSPICNLYIPNAFSPNNDGKNDSFDIFTDFNMRYEISIFDRWGGMIHHGFYISNQPGWSPTDINLGVYVYKIIIDGVLYTGDVTILK